MRRVPLLLALALAGCVSGDTGIGGELSVRSDEYGSWTMSPTDCGSGERLSFFGADLIEGDDIGTAARVVLDPIEGWHVLMNVPGEDFALVITADDDCERFDVDARRTNTRVNEIWEIEGHANITCRLPGLEIDADLSFAACY